MIIAYAVFDLNASAVLDSPVGGAFQKVTGGIAVCMVAAYRDTTQPASADQVLSGSFGVLADTDNTIGLVNARLGAAVKATGTLYGITPTVVVLPAVSLLAV